MKITNTQIFLMAFGAIALIAALMISTLFLGHTVAPPPV